MLDFEFWMGGCSDVRYLKAVGQKVENLDRMIDEEDLGTII